jgi:hypothetical protein
VTDRSETVPPVADLLWLLHGSRLTLDAIANGREGADHAAAQAQRIVDHLGHRVTDEPPHTLVENDRLREALLTAAAGIDVLIAGGTDQAGNLRRLADYMRAEAAEFGSRPESEHPRTGELPPPDDWQPDNDPQPPGKTVD